MKNSILFIAFTLCIILFASCASDPENKPAVSATATSPRKVLILAVDGGGVKDIDPSIFNLTQSKYQIEYNILHNGTKNSTKTSTREKSS